MADRIADPWGERTPYGCGEEWPVRVDEHRVDEPERWVPTASVLHSNGDAFDLGVKGGRLVGVRGRAGDRVNRGRLGPKDLYGWQAMGSADRLTRPLVREGGELRETNWETVHLSEQAVEPPEEARSDLDIFLDYARRMDFRDKDGAPLVTWHDAES